MYIHFLLRALFALPFASAVPLSLSDAASVDLHKVVSGHGLADALTGDSVSDNLKDGINTITQVNAALGNIVPDRIETQSVIEKTLSDIRREVSDIQQLSVTFAGLLQAIVANTVPKDLPDTLTKIQAIVGNLNNTNSTIESISQAILNGLLVTDLTQNVLAGYALSPINSYDNKNPPSPTTIYPHKNSNDASYTVAETQLRSAIYIPPTFTYGRSNKRPILFVPGTGAFGGVNFISNLGKLLGGDPRFDPVYLNVPGAMLNDTQVNSEYIAYAINYLSAITNNSNRLAVIPWSQGNPDTQWAFQYWPSTRSVVEDFISISADFHGTTLAYLLDPAFPAIVPNPPSIIQQKYDSNFILTLRAGGGGSPYVPSTSIWSITDEIVQPQYSPFASAAYSTQDLPGTPDTNALVCPANQNQNQKQSVAYTNAQIQTVCQGQPAGGIYTHEGMLYNPLAYALAIDALTNPGPGRIERIDLNAVCNQVVAPGLSLADVLATEGLIPLALLNILLYPEKVQDEPAVRAEALQANAVCASGNSVGGGTSNGHARGTPSATAPPTTTTTKTTMARVTWTTSSGAVKATTTKKTVPGA